MTEHDHHIRLAAGIEIRRPAPGAVFEFGRDASDRLGARIAEDLAEVAGAVTSGHLVTGAALLEPGQMLNPEFAPWEAMRHIAGLEAGFEPGITAIGVHRGQPPSETLVPFRVPPQGLFLCLPILLAVPDGQSDRVRSLLESTLFESGGLRPPAMGTLAEITGLDPVHGQLMTAADLMALLRVQLAGAGLDPFWPPVEHALLEPGSPARLALPGGVGASWNTEARGWEIDFVGYDESGTSAEEWALWLRALRQATALLESFLLRWRVTAGSPDSRIEPDSRWVERVLGPATDTDGSAWQVEHDDVGLVGYAAVLDGCRYAFYPMDPGSIDDLESHLRERGAADIERSRDMDRLTGG